MEANPFDDPSVSAQSSSKEEAALPSWLEDVPVDTAPLTAAEPVASSRGYEPPGSNWVSEDGGIVPPAATPPAEPAKDNLIVYMRLCNVAVTVLMGTTCVLELMSLPGFNTAILTLYIWFFAILLCCFETHLKQVSKLVAENFGFLYHVKGRVAFLVLVAMLCFGIGILGKITALALLAAAGFNVYVLYKHPEYEQEQQRSDREQRGPANVVDLYASQDSFLASGAAWAQQNPDLAVGAVSAGAQFAADNPQLARDAAATAYGNV